MMPSKSEVYASLEQRHGAAVQTLFANAKVAICGLGGLGSNVAIALARAGVGSLHLIDFDKVDLSNLNRQQYEVSQLGLYKTDAMKQTISKIAPYCNIKIDTVQLTERNIPLLLGDSEIICEAFDHPEAKAMLVNSVSEQFPKKYIVAASGMSGLHTGNTILTRKITSNLYICGDSESDVKTDGTLFAPRVMLCAAHQAHTILRIIAGKEDF